MAHRFICALLIAVAGRAATAGEVVSFLGYKEAIELRNGSVRVVLCPEVGGRVLEYSLKGTNVLHVSDDEKAWQPGDRPASSAGRFDIGPEYIVPKRQSLWSGKWTYKITGPRSAVLTSSEDSATGVRLTRDFQLDAESSHLKCVQTIHNVSRSATEWCHWSRTFAVGKGICVIPLTPADQPPQSRFPKGYVMYEGRGLINVLPDDPNIRSHKHSLQIYPTPKQPKLGFDSYAGTIFYAAPNDLLFTKRFRTWPDRVYNEVAGLTISVWYPNREMVELEPIGPREKLQPGESASFTEDWYLHEFPFPDVDQPIDPDTLEMVSQAKTSDR